jgi:hypothetical protein
MERSKYFLAMILCLAGMVAVVYAGWLMWPARF